MRVKFNRLVILRYRLLIVAQVIVEIPAVGVDSSILRVKCNCMVILRYRLLEASFVRMGYWES